MYKEDLIEMNIKKTYKNTSYSFKAMFKKLTIVFLFFIANSSLAQITSYIDSTQIKIGEEIKYTIEVETDSTQLVKFPEGQTFIPLEVIESFKIDTSYQGTKYRLIKKYGLTQFDSGHYYIPPQKIIIKNKQYSTDSIKVEVNNVEVDTLKQKMFPIKPAIEVPPPSFDFKELLIWLLPLLLILGTIIYLLIQRKKRKELEKEKLPPYEEALVALKKLDEKQLLKENKSKEYYSRLTEITKHYLDKEVDDTALERTTDELIERLQLHKDAGHFDFDTQTIKKLEQILKRADLIKFAKMKETQGQAKADRVIIEDIINETHEIIPELTEEELLENQLYLDQQQKLKKRKKIKITIISIFAGLLILLGIYGSIKGFDAVKDIFITNITKQLSKGEWIKSEYGNPAIILETPKVLERKEITIPEADKNSIKEINRFSFGNKKDFYTMLSTVSYKGDQKIELETAIDATLSGLEKQGALNMIVKREDFETKKGIKGLKAYGTFNYKDEKGTIFNTPIYYELLLFAQQNGLQQIVMMYPENDSYAVQIKDKIINSVELVIEEGKK